MITVVVPVYNMGKFVERAVQSLLQQDYKDYEIVLVDDGSTDNGGAICDRLCESYDCIRVVHKENGGLSSARNAGIDAAKGKYIIFPDPDDWTDAAYLRNMMELHDKFDSDMEICGHYISDDNKEVMHNGNATTCLLQRQEALVELMQPTAYCGFAWNKLYHMDIISKAKLRFDTELGMAQDLHFALRYLMLCDKIAYNPAPVYHYFQHAGGVTNTAMPLTKRKISGLQTYLKIAALTEQDYPQVAAMAYATLCNLCVHFMYIYYNSKMNGLKTMKQLRQYLRQYQRYFFASDAYDKTHRALFRLARLSPYIYYLVKSTGEKIRKR